MAETNAIMASNIENILARGERIYDLQEESKELHQMSCVFKKRAKQVKRVKMWQNAVVGTAVTGWSRWSCHYTSTHCPVAGLEQHH